MSNDGSNAQSANARELIERLHDLGTLLMRSSDSGLSNEVAIESGLNKRAQRMLEDICSMLRPVAKNLDRWEQPIARVEIPGKVDLTSKEGRGRGDTRGGKSSSNSSSLYSGLPRQEQAELQAAFRRMNGGGHNKNPRRTTTFSLADLAGSLKLSVKAEVDKPGRGMGTETTNVEANLPVSFMRAAFAQVWELLDEIDLGIPRADYRPENQMEWDIEEDFEDE